MKYIYFYLEFCSDLCSQYPWKLFHVKPSNPWMHNDVNHGGHAVHLRLVDGDLGVDGVLTLLHFDCIINSIDYRTYYFLIQVPRNALPKK